MRSILLAAAATLMLTTIASAGPGGPSHAAGPYILDSHGQCRARGGQKVLANLCSAPPNAPRCRAGETKPCGHTCISIHKHCHV